MFVLYMIYLQTLIHPALIRDFTHFETTRSDSPSQDLCFGFQAVRRSYSSACDHILYWRYAPSIKIVPICIAGATFAIRYDKILQKSGVLIEG